CHETHPVHPAAERVRRSGARGRAVRRAPRQHRRAHRGGHPRPGDVAAHPGDARRRGYAGTDPAPAAQAGGRAGREQPVAAGQPRRQPAGRRHAGMNARLATHAAVDDAPSDLDLLRRTLAARVYEVARETPLEPASLLSARLGNRVLLKREDTQPVFSFKLRGAYNKMSHMSAAERSGGVIAASAGNHAQGVALAAQRLGCAATIVMPVTTPQIKIAAVEARGARVVLHGDSYTDAFDKARQLQKETGATFVHPYDDPDVIAGQGTIGMEILRQWQAPLDAIFVAIGGGGLIGGIAAYVKRVRPEVKIIGVQPEDADAMARSLAAGRRITLAHVGLFADGVAVKQVGRETFRLARQYVDDIILVDTDALCAALKDVFED